MSGNDHLVTSADFGAGSRPAPSTGQISQVSVESEIMRLSQSLEEHTDAMVKAETDAGFYDAEYDIEYALAFSRQSNGTVDHRKAKAMLECADLYRKKARTEARAKALRAAGHNIRAQLDALRSVAASLRSQA